MSRPFKIPLSVLVVIHTPALEVLLIQRADAASFWQSVTGSKDHEDETFEATAIREVAEETGCRIAHAHCFAVETVPLWGARNHIHLVAAETSDQPAPDGREIVAAAFFAPAALPATIADAARSRIERWRTRDQNNES